MAQMVETVTGPTMADLRTARDAAVGDLVELRLDGVTDLDVAGALAGRRGRSSSPAAPRGKAGGSTGAEEERLAILAVPRRSGPSSSTWSSPPRGATSRGARHAAGAVDHDFTGVPADLASASTPCAAPARTSSRSPRARIS